MTPLLFLTGCCALSLKAENIHPYRLNNNQSRYPIENPAGLDNLAQECLGGQAC